MDSSVHAGCGLIGAIVAELVEGIDIKFGGQNEKPTGERPEPPTAPPIAGGRDEDDPAEMVEWIAISVLQGDVTTEDKRQLREALAKFVDERINLAFGRRQAVEAQVLRGLNKLRASTGLPI